MTCMRNLLSNIFKDATCICRHSRCHNPVISPWRQLSQIGQLILLAAPTMATKLGAFQRLYMTASHIDDQHHQQADTMSRITTDSSSTHWADMITQHTLITTNHLTPEIQLGLITPQCPLWHQNPDHCPFDDPFWAFYWPGGQALTRFILDNSHIIKGRSVLDVGSGCGASAIAAVRGGAKRVVANDIDQVAIEAIKLNAALNNVDLEISSNNMIGQTETGDNHWDVVFLGDMFYDRDFTSKVADWLQDLMSEHKSRILIGDPGRVYLMDHPMRERLVKLFEIKLPLNCIEENRGHSTGYVWELLQT